MHSTRDFPLMGLAKTGGVIKYTLILSTGSFPFKCCILFHNSGEELTFSRQIWNELVQISRRPCIPLSSRMFFGGGSSMIALILTGLTSTPDHGQWFLGSCLGWPWMHILVGSLNRCDVVCWIRSQSVSGDLFFGVTYYRIINITYHHISKLSLRVMSWLVGM